jgi:APA family basic amino acid/polyamine antiporter
MSSADTTAASRAHAQLVRTLGVPGAVLMGLGSILGTGIFVSLGIAAGVAGGAVVLAVALGAVVATCNGLSSAQLAAAHPVSGGTYEYGYRLLSPRLGFTAGWMFLCAKSASAATAALGFAGYALTAFGETAAASRTALALGVVLAMTLVVAGGLTRSHRVNTIIVGTTLVALGSFVAFGLPSALEREHLADVGSQWAAGLDPRQLLEATALMFVAYTGYGRVATLGEEIRDPAKNIPKAVVLTLLVSMFVYVSVACVAVGAVGAQGLAEATGQAAAPLEWAARTFHTPAVRWVVSLGALTAMLGVLLNLLLGLSRVLLAMARRGDMPGSLAELSARDRSPVRAVFAIGAFVAALTLLGSVRTTWSFSAFTVLLYYSLTNWAALRLPSEARRYPRAVPALGLLSCLGLAFWVEPAIWGTGLGLVALGLLWQVAAQRLATKPSAARVPRGS